MAAVRLVVTWTALLASSAAVAAGLDSRCFVTPGVMDNFDVTKLIDTSKVWFEVWRSKQEISDGGRCKDVQFLPPDSTDHDAIYKTHTFYPTNCDSKEFSEATGLLTYKTPQLMKYEHTSSPGREKTGDSLTFWVTATDYTNFIVAVFCVPNGDPSGDLPKVFAVVLAPTRKLSKEFESAARTALNDSGVFDVEASPQDGCPGRKSPPVPAPPPGPGCKPVSVMDNFDAGKYVGSWHDVQVSLGYFAGRCPSHVFSSESNTLAYFEKLYSFITGKFTAFQGAAHRVSGAKFRVTPPKYVQGKSAPERDYWVLDTDYISYSVVYSCAPLKYGNTDIRVRVLGRAYGQLTMEANDKVLTALKNLADQLDEDIYLNDVSDKVCVPDVCPKFMNNNTMQSLNVQRFAGDWHLVAQDNKYLTDRCVTFRHTVTANSSLFVQITGPGPSFPLQTQEVTPADILAHDGRYVTQGMEPTAQYNILRTDYESWAVLYLCQESTDNTPVQMRTVLLSRGSALSPDDADQVGEVLQDFGMDIKDFKSNSWEGCAALGCPSPVLEPAPDRLFEGDWKVVAETAAPSETGFCSKHTFRRVGSEIQLNMTQFDDKFTSFVIRRYKLTADSSPGKYLAKNTDNETDTFGFWILGSDGAKFAVTYACSDDQGGSSGARTWVLGRESSLDVASANRVRDIIINNYLDISAIDDVEHHISPCTAPLPPEGRGAAVTARLSTVLVLAALVTVTLARLANTRG